MDDKDYLIPEFEERLEKAKKIKEKIDNPESDRLLSFHNQLKEEYQKLMNDKTFLYQAAKEIMANKFPLVCRTDKNEVGFIQDYSLAGHPEIRYADKDGFTLPITTSRRCPFLQLTPKEFMTKIISGDYKPLDYICLRCGKMFPRENTICPHCGEKI